MDPLLLGSCMLLRSGKTKGETKMPPSELNKFMELGWRSLANVMKNDRRKKFVGRRREDDTRRSGDERRKNGDGWKKRELEGQKR